MRGVAALLALWIAAAAANAGAAGARTYVVSGRKYYAVSEEKLKALGLPRRDVAAERNSAELLLQALAKLPPLPKDKMKSFNRAQRVPWEPRFDELIPWLEANEPAFELIRKAVRLPDCQFPVLTKRPDPDVLGNPALLYSAQLPHLGQLRQVARICAVRGRRLESQGKLREALGEHLLALHLGRLITGQGFMITDLVGIALQNIGWKHVQRTALSTGPDAEALEWLARELDAIAAQRRDWSAASLYEKVAVLRMHSPEALVTHGGRTPGGEAMRAFIKSRAWRILAPDRTAKAEAETYFQQMIDAAKMPTWEGLKAVSRLTPGRGKGPRDIPGISRWNVLIRILVPAVSRFAGQHVQSVAQIEGLRIAVAVRRFQIAKAKTPAALKELAPEFLKQVPPDPYTGKPFYYAITQQGWKLWSVGRNLANDRGHRRRDVVIEFGTGKGRAK